MSYPAFYGSGATAISGRLLLEAAGTGFLVLAGTKVAMDAASGQPIAGVPVGSLGVAAVFGVTLMFLVYALGPRTGAHLNPAVTLGAIIVRAIGLVEGGLYMLAQLGGAVAAGFILKVSLADSVVAKGKLGMTILVPPSTKDNLVLYEALGTSLLMLAVLFAAVSGRVPDAASGLAVGGALFVGIMMIGANTGGGINPARVLGPMIALNTYPNWWLYVLSEFGGAAIVAVVYRATSGVTAPSP